MTPAEGARFTVLVVSEDAAFLVEARDRLGAAGIHVIGCMGPAQSPCELDFRDSCRLADHADAAIVDVPPTGLFTHHWQQVSATAYASSLARQHPHLFVVPCGSPIGNWPGTSVSSPMSRTQALDLLERAATSINHEQNISGSRSREGALT